MSARLLTLSYVPLLAAALIGGHGQGWTSFRYIDIPPDVIDVEVNPAGSIFLLRRGLPRLQVISPDGSSSGHDLSGTLLPGGLCVDDRWGWFVTGEILDRVHRYDRSGETMDSWDAAGLPGDICFAGLSVFYVSRATGTIRSLYDPGIEIARLAGSGEGQIASYRSGAVYSAEDESLVLGVYSSPEPLPFGGIWTGCGDRLVVLQDSCVRSEDGRVLFELPSPGEFSRISCSRDGRHCILWSPGKDRVMVLQ